MSLFNDGAFALHSGTSSSFLIDCEALTDADLDALARRVAARVGYATVEGVPRGGLRFAEALDRYKIPGDGGLLIADDVLTTGASMEEHRARRAAVGVVIFARAEPPPWVVALWRASL